MAMNALRTLAPFALLSALACGGSNYDTASPESERYGYDDAAPEFETQPENTYRGQPQNDMEYRDPGANELYQQNTPGVPSQGPDQNTQGVVPRSGSPTQQGTQPGQVDQDTRMRSPTETDNSAMEPIRNPNDPIRGEDGRMDFDSHDDGEQRSLDLQGNQ